MGGNLKTGGTNVGAPGPLKVIPMPPLMLLLLFVIGLLVEFVAVVVVVATTLSVLMAQDSEFPGLQMVLCASASGSGSLLPVMREKEK